MKMKTFPPADPPFDWELYHKTIEIARKLETRQMQIALNQRHTMKAPVVQAYMDILAERGVAGWDPDPK